MNKANNTLEEDIINISNDLDIYGDSTTYGKALESLHADLPEDVKKWVEGWSILDIAHTEDVPADEVNQKVKQTLETIMKGMGALNHGHKLDS